MAENIFLLESDALPDDSVVVAFRGREALSEPYAIEIGITTNDTDFVHDDAVLARATLRFNLGRDSEPYHYHGIIASMELIHEHEGRMLYRALLVPKLWTLTISEHSNVWTDESVDTIIEDVLEWSGLAGSDFELRLNETYEPREFVAQYKETNFAFISRWMERLGMFYFFEQGDDAEKLVITDHKSFDDAEEGRTVRYVPASEGDRMAEEAFTLFRSKSRALPGKVQLWDYDYLNPTLDVKADKKVADEGVVGEVSRFGDDFFSTPTEGDRLAKVRAEQYRAQQQVFFGRGRVYHLHAGNPYTLEEHPRADLSDQIYLITAIDFQGNQSSESGFLADLLNVDVGNEIYVAEVSSIRGDVQFRAQSRTPWPRVEGYESATVCGEASSEYAQIDENGRYHVRILFDESDLGDGKASAWLRMQQPYGGTTEGFHFPLVKGTEVLLWFMGGDPDRPVIAGVAPNMLTQSPVTDENHTRNILRTVHQNLIEIEDLADKMFMFFRCPIEDTWIHMGFKREDWNLILNTEGDVHFDFTGLQLIDIDNTLTENVKLDVTYNYDDNFIVNLENNWDFTIAKGKWILDVQTGDVDWTLASDWKADITGDIDFEVKGDVVYMIFGDSDITVQGDDTRTVMGDQTSVVMGDQTNVLMGDESSVVMGDETSVTVGDATGVVVGDRNITVVGKNNVQVLSDCSWFDMGAKAQIKLSAEANLNIGAKAEIAISAEAVAKLSAALEVALGVKIEAGGPSTIKLETMVIDTAASKIEAGVNKIKNKATKLDALGLYLVF